MNLIDEVVSSYPSKALTKKAERLGATIADQLEANITKRVYDLALDFLKDQAQEVLEKDEYVPEEELKAMIKESDAYQELCHTLYGIISKSSTSTLENL